MKSARTHASSSFYSNLYNLSRLSPAHLASKAPGCREELLCMSGGSDQQQGCEASRQLVYPPAPGITQTVLQHAIHAVQSNMQNLASRAQESADHALQQAGAGQRKSRLEVAPNIVAGYSQYGSDCGLYRDGQVTGKLRDFVRGFLDGTIYEKVGIHALVQAAQDHLDAPAPPPSAAAAQVASSPDAVAGQQAAAVGSKRKRKSSAVLLEGCKEVARVCASLLKDFSAARQREDSERALLPPQSDGDPEPEQDVPDHTPVRPRKEMPNKDVMLRIRKNFTDQVLNGMVGVLGAAWGVQDDDKGFGEALHWSIGKRRRHSFNSASNSLEGADDEHIVNSSGLLHSPSDIKRRASFVTGRSRHVSNRAAKRRAHARERDRRNKHRQFPAHRPASFSAAIFVSSMTQAALDDVRCEVPHQSLSCCPCLHARILNLTTPLFLQPRVPVWLLPRSQHSGKGQCHHTLVRRTLAGHNPHQRRLDDGSAWRSLSCGFTRYQYESRVPE